MAQIEVSIKIRPLIGRETGESRLWVIPDENQIVQVDPHTKNHRGETYCFDHVFSERCSNKEVFGIVSKSIVEAAVNGFNGTIFAYGQTSSGKTHTMRGSSNDPGIIELAVEYLFELIGQKLDREFLLRVSYIEIYNETINDLLKRDNVNLKVKEEGGQVIIPSATEETETTIAGIIGLLERGENNRRIAETCMNDRSSRSHAIFRLIIESKGIDDAVQVSQLNLVDLAGSERTGLSGLTGSTFKEGIHINKSLTVLGKVIKDLSENPDGFINYRDSKLTRILQPALGGNALTAIICTVAPASADHTTSTLGFAQRAKKIKNKPKVNEVLTKDAHIKRMHLKMAELQAELDACKGSKTKEDDAFNAFNEEKLKHLQKLENMIINGTVGSHQTNTLKQKAKRRQTWCDTKSFKQVRKSVGELSSTTPSRNPAASQLWMLQSIQEQDSFASGSTEDNADFLSQYTADVFEAEFVTSPPPENFGTPSAAIFSGFVTTQRGNGSRYHTNNVQTPPNLLRERADAYCQELQALQNITVKEKQINNEKLLEKLNQIDAENLKLKKELARWETSKFETEYEQEKKLEKAQKRAHELQSSLESAWSSQADIENQASILETENKALLSKIDLMSQTKRNISEKAIQTTQDDLGRSTDKNASVLLKDRLDRHKLALLNEIVALNPKFEVDAPANSDEELLLKLLISTVTEKEQYFFSNLTESYDSKEKVLSNEVISLKQTIEKMKNEKTNFKENEDLRFQELSKDFESLLEEKQRTISQLEQNLVAAQARVLQISEHINKESSNELLVDKDEQITELQTNLLAANEASSLKSQLISDLEEKLFLKQNQLQEKIIHITDLETRLSTVADDSLQNSLFVIPNSEEQIDTKLSLNDEILKQYSQQITDLELKLLQMEEENLHKIEIINKFETKQEKMKNSMEENAKMMAELESCYGSQVNTLQAKLVEVEYLLQEKMETILDLEVKLSASSNEDSQEIVTEDRKETQNDAFKAKLTEMENLLEEKMLTIANLEENQSKLGNEETQQNQVVILQAKLAAMGIRLQEEMLTIAELESMRPRNVLEDSQEYLSAKLKVKIRELENKLQEKLLSIANLESKLSEFSTEDSQVAWVDTQAKLMEVESLLQKKVLIIKDLESKLSEESTEDSQDPRTDILQAKLMEVENLLHEKVHVITELESKLSEVSTEDSQDARTDILQAKLMEVEKLLQEKMHVITELESKLSEVSTEDSQDPRTDILQAKLMEVENLLQEKVHVITELESKLSEVSTEDSQDARTDILQAKLMEVENLLQEKMHVITELESKLSEVSTEDSQDSRTDILQAKLMEVEKLLQEKVHVITELESKLSEVSTEDSQDPRTDILQAKLMEVENLLQEKVHVITELESKLSEVSTEDSQDPRTDILQAKLMEVENLLQEKVHVITELESKLSEVSTEDSQDARTDILQAKLMEVENLLQEKVHVITELESKLSEVSTKDSQDARTDILQAKLMEVENLLQEKMHVITELESKLSEVSTEDSQDSRTDILQAKLMEVENLLQEKMHAITELESKLSEVSTEDSQDARTDTLQAKLMEVEGLLQEKVLFINELESKLAEINTTDSQDARVDTLQAECMQVENLPQENVLIIKELESKLAETSNEDSRDVRMDALQAKLMQLESLLHEKVSIITELESKLSAVSTEDSQDARGVDTLQAKLMEVESLLQDKVFIIDELESKLSAVSTEDSQDARGVDTLQAKLMEVESLLQEKALNITELESKLAELSSKDQGTLMKTVKVKEEISYQETMMNISEMDLKLSEANQYDNSSPGKSWKLGDTGVKLDNIHEESSSFTQPSPTFLESLEKIMGMHSELSPCRQNRIPNVSGGSESDITELKSAFVSIQHTRVEDTELRAKVVAPLETSDCETQTEIITLDQSIATDVYEVSDEDKNIIHVLENQLEKIRNELVCKVDEIQSMQTLLSDKCLTIEALKVSYSKIDSEFKSFAENSVVVINKLQGVESELDSKLKFIALLETKLHENSRTTENLKENLICCDVNFNKNVEKISLLEDQLIQVKASLKATQEENESLQKALFEKALHAEDLEGKCSEQEARFREQSTRFQLLEDKLHQVKADFKKSLDNVCSLQDDLKEKSMFIKELQSHSSDVDEKLQLCSNEIQDLKGELIRKSSLIESLESKTKTSVAHLKESLETIRSLEEDRKKQIMEIENGQEKLENLEIAKMNMKKAQENDQFTIQCLKEKMDSMKKELNEKLSTIEDMSIKIDSLHKSLAEKMVVVQTLTEKSDCSENELSVKLNEIKLLNSQIEKQNKALSENTLAIQNMEEKLASYEKDLKDKLERIKETNDRMDRQRMLLEDRVNLIQNLEKSLATRPYKDDLEKQSAVIRTLQLQLAAREESIKENSESTNAAKELQDQVLNLKRKNHDMAETNQELIEKLEAAKRQNEDLDKENDNLNCLWLETDKFAKETESELEAEIEKLKAELELARSSLDAAKEDKELLNTKVAKYQSLQSDLTNREKELLTLQTQNKTLKENVELSMHSKQLLEKELESLKRSPCECKSLKNRVKVLLKDLEKTNLELVQRNGEFAGLELQIMKEEFPHKNAAEQLRKENAEMKDMIKTLKTELRRMEAAAPNETKNACQVCLGKPRATESPLRMVPTNSTKLQENRSEDLERVLAALQEKNQLYKKIAHDRMQYIVKLEKEKETLVPGFKSRYVVNKENK